MKTVEELRKLREEVRHMTKLREGEAEIRLTVGMGTCGIAAGARDTLGTLISAIAEMKLAGVVVTQTGCLGLCEREPIVEVNAPDGRTIYARVTPERARRILIEHVQGGAAIEEWAIRS